MQRKSILLGIIVILFSVIIGEIFFLLSNRGPEKTSSNVPLLKITPTTVPSTLISTAPLQPAIDNTEELAFNSQALQNLMKIPKGDVIEGMLHYVYEGEIHEIAKDGVTKEGVPFDIRIQIGKTGEKSTGNYFYYTKAFGLTKSQVFEDSPEGRKAITLSDLKIGDKVRIEMDLDLVTEWGNAVKSYLIIKNSGS